MGMLSAMVWSPRPVWRPRHPRRMGGFHWSFPSMLRAPWADPPVPAGLVPQHAQNGHFSGRNAPANPKVRGCRAQPPTASLFAWAPTPAQERQQELVGSGRP